MQGGIPGWIVEQQQKDISGKIAEVLIKSVVNKVSSTHLPFLCHPSVL